MDLNSLLRPRSIAVIGASNNPGFGRASCANLIDSPISERIYFINPRPQVIMGKQTLEKVQDVPEPIDLAVIATPKSTVIPLLKDAASMGCKAAVVYASGYSELGREGARDEQELRQVAEELGIAVCGPNCAGFVNNIDGIKAFGLTITIPPRVGNVGLLAQSGQVCNHLMSVKQLGFSYCISSGNNAVVDNVDYLRFLVEDDNTKVIAMYLEGVRQPDALVEALDLAAKRRKPVVILKTGISEKGQKIATAHTGSLTGSDSAYNALFSKLGVLRVYDMEELVTTCMLLSYLDSIPAEPTFAVLNLSGGEAAIAADLTHLNGLELAEFRPETLDKLGELLPFYATPNNPLDTTATLAQDPETYYKVLKTVMADPNVGFIVVSLRVPELIDSSNQRTQMGLCNAITRAAQEENAKPIIIVSSLSGQRAPELLEKYTAAGVPILSSPKYGFSAIKHLVSLLKYQRPETVSDMVKVKVAHTGQVKRRICSEHESKSMLQRYGLPVTKESLVNDEESLLRAADAIGYPVVLKVDSADLPHKTEAGAVKLNVSRDQLVDAYGEILSNVRNYDPNAKINGVLVQEMLPPGMEVIVGVNRDEQFGPMILVGLGGILVEVFKDVAIRLAPLTKQEALEMIESLRAAPLFHGYRGGPELDVDALANLLVNVSKFAFENSDEVLELDMNPVFVYPKGQGVRIADALLVRNA